VTSQLGMISKLLCVLELAVMVSELLTYRVRALLTKAAQVSSVWQERSRLVTI